MATKPKSAPKVRKLATFDADVWQQIEDYRFTNRIKTETEVLRQLVEIGLKHAPKRK